MKIYIIINEYEEYGGMFTSPMCKEIKGVTDNIDKAYQFINIPNQSKRNMWYIEVWDIETNKLIDTLGLGGG